MVRKKNISSYPNILPVTHPQALIALLVDESLVRSSERSPEDIWRPDNHSF